MNNIKLHKSLLMALCLLSVSNLSYASDTPSIEFDLDGTIVSATKTTLTPKELPQSVEVISKKDIQNIGAISVRDVLKTASSITIYDGGAYGHGDKLSMRGGSTNDILILVNGQRVAGENYFMNGSSNTKILDRLNLNNVERIEILRGPGGALYGSDAQNGVINIITNSSPSESAIVGFASGTREISNTYHFNTGVQGNLSAIFDLSFNKLRDIDSRANGKHFAMGDSQNYSGTFNYSINPNNKLSLGITYDKDNLEYRAKGNLRNLDENRTGVSLNYQSNNLNNSYALNLGYNNLDKGLSSEYNIWSIDARNSTQIDNSNKLTYGAEFSTTNGNAYIPANSNHNDKADKYALYVQDEYKYGKLLLIPSLRYDYHDTSGSNISPNIGTTYFASDSTRIKAQFGSAYRAPSVEELYCEFGHGGSFVLKGNPDLKPEKTRGYEFTLEHDWDDRTNVRTTYFHNQKKDAISSALIGDCTHDRKVINIDKTQSNGVEVELKHNLGQGFTLSGSYNYLDATNDVTNTPLSYVADHTYIAKLQWTDPTTQEWTVTALNKWVSDYHFTSGGMGRPTVYKTTSGNLFNIAINKRWADKYRAFVGLDNAFNKKDNSELNYYGRFWRVGAEFKF